MKLDKVQINQFRNIQDLSLTLNSHLNVFIGENGSGKSSILEAIHYLGFARSFRTNKHSNVIRRDKPNFTIFCRCSDDQNLINLGIHRTSDNQCTVNINGQKSKKATDLVSQLPIQIFTPQSSDLLLGSPKLRRKYLDWALFHVEQSFNIDAQTYTKALKQLNALYRNNGLDDTNKQYWMRLVADKGERLTEYRSSMLDNGLIELINSNLKTFLPEFSFEISYHRGWEKGMSLAQSLEKNAVKDQRYGFVSNGPHKADVRIKSNGINAHEILSRGQLRMLVAAMQLALTEYLNQSTNKNTVFLLDDIGAELDEEKRQVFIQRLSELKSQIFITAIDKNQLNFLNNYNDKKVFHVEHGHVKEEI
jgi:DNA replication and repair protein RecF